MGAKRGSVCHTYVRLPHQSEAKLVWKCEKERRTRTHAASVQHDSKSGTAERKITVEIYGQHT